MLTHADTLRLPGNQAITTVEASLSKSEFEPTILVGGEDGGPSIFFIFTLSRITMPHPRFVFSSGLWEVTVMLPLAEGRNPKLASRSLEALQGRVLATASLTFSMSTTFESTLCLTSDALYLHPGSISSSEVVTLVPSIDGASMDVSACGRWIAVGHLDSTVTIWGWDGSSLIETSSVALPDVGLPRWATHLQWLANTPTGYSSSGSKQCFPGDGALFCGCNDGSTVILATRASSEVDHESRPTCVGDYPKRLSTDGAIHHEASSRQLWLPGTSGESVLFVAGEGSRLIKVWRFGGEAAAAMGGFVAPSIKDWLHMEDPVALYCCVLLNLTLTRTLYEGPAYPCYQYPVSSHRPE